VKEVGGGSGSGGGGGGGGGGGPMRGGCVIRMQGEVSL